MSNELTPQESFQEKMKERVTQGIGDLMPDEMLKQLIEKAIDDAFFKPQKQVIGSGYHQKQVDGPSWFEEHLSKLIEPMLKEKINEWMQRPENAEVILKEIKPFLERSSNDAILSAFSQAFGANLQNMQWQLQTQLQNAINGNGWTS